MDEATSKEWSERKAKELLDAFRDSLDGIDGPFREREQAALRLANELVRQWTQAELQRMASRYGDEIVVGAHRYRRHSSGVRRYHSLCGAVAIRRDIYRQVGIHNGPTVVPLEIEAGIVENATPSLVASVSQAFAAMPLRHYEVEMKAAHRRVPSRSTLERIGKRVGATIQEELAVIEPVLRADTVLPGDARSISVGLDRTTIPMAEPCAARRPRRDRPYLRRPPAPVAVAYRMAYVATIAVHDCRGKTLHSVRLAATAGEGPDELLVRFVAELQHLRSQNTGLPLTIVQDGAPELWTLVEDALARVQIPVSCKLIDRYHVDERLAATAAALEKDAGRARRLLRRWRTDLDRDDAAARRICRYLDRALHGPRKHERDFWPIDRGRVHWVDRHIVDSNLAYFLKCASRMNYANARRRGFPLGSGVTEGACKSVIAARFKRSGQRWHETGASTCLLLRTFHLDDRLDAALQLHIASRERALAC